MEHSIPAVREFTVALIAAVAGMFWGTPLAARADQPQPADEIPKAIKMVKPEYPYSLLFSYNTGTVVLDFIIDPTGKIRDVRVIRSSHPDFEAPAVAAFLKWKFTPGRKNGVAVATHMRLPIMFYINDGRGVEPWTVPSTGSKQLPPEFRYDEAPTPWLTTSPVFPYDLLVRHVTGKATVTFMIDPRGCTRKVTVTSSSNPEFAAAVKAMMEAWQFEPARMKGRPSWAMLSKKQVFDREDRDTAVSESAERLLRAMRKTPCPILGSMRDLDAPLRARYQPSPAVPEEMETANVAATASIKFIVDRDGQAQLPQIVSASREDFGWAAATAVARWQFSVPTKNHKPVDVYAIVPMRFDPKQAAKSLSKS